MMQEMYKCKFCNKICKNSNSLRQHELHCKENLNRVSPSPNFKNNGNSTRGKIWITNNVEQKIVLPKEYEEIYSKQGWIKGQSKKYRDTLKGKSKGIASSVEAEIERRKKISETMRKNHNAGGYRKGSGRGKQGWYKGIYCDSSWELAFVYYHLENNLDIKRCTDTRTYIYEGVEHTYIPDFVTKDGIIEIKGYNTKQALAKHLQNSDIKVLYYDDMKFYINYAIDKVGKDFYKKLYGEVPKRS